MVVARGTLSSPRVIRTILLVAALGVSTGCSSLPGFDRPQVDVAAHLAVYQLRGRARMQSIAGGGGLQENGNVDLHDLGVGERDDDVGGTISVGDGFSGTTLSYQKLTMQDSRPATVPTAFGALVPGDEVRTKVVMDELRLRYIGEVYELQLKNKVEFTFGLGGAIAHRDLELFPKRTSDGTGQILQIKDDGVPYLAGRGRATYGQTSVQLDWAHNFGLDFGGDFDGDLQDIEITVRYAFPLQNVSVYGGWRRSDLPAGGHMGPFTYAAAFVLEGYFLGAEMRF